MTMKKMTRKMPKDGQTSEWVFLGQETQLFWVLRPENHRTRGRSRNPRGGDTRESHPPQHMFNFPPEAPRGPKPTGASMSGVVPPPSAAGIVGGATDLRPSGFSFGIPSMVNFPGGMPMPPPGRN
ncbi:hypothetical protein Trco_002148 [Trichoderma cornu-damae]|uniref:Uncharacterized protein n=1 Tax=Trichoderma cornu-damae TaxID=654480 RepID=A0A9P8QUH1_9HYPO|nr:hypothetical protein Trco_002148 [Trichoderma cornu-damae]